jgi:MFS family permease
MPPPVIVRLWLMVLLGNITFTGGRLALLLGARELNASPTVMGLLIALGAVTGALTAVHVGKWFDRYHHGRVLQIGLGCILASMILATTRFTLDSMLIASAISGFGINILQIGGQGLTGYYSTPENRPRHYNFIAFALSLSLLLGPAVAGYSIDYLGFRGSYVIFAALAFLASLAISRGLGRPAPKKASAPGQKAGNALELFRNPGLRRLYFMDLLFATGWNSLGFLVPLYGAQIGLSARRSARSPPPAPSPRCSPGWRSRSSPAT